MLGGWHNATQGALSIFEIDIDTCSVIPTSFDTPYNDVESLTSSECVVEGIVEGQITNPLADGRAQQAVAGVEVKLEVDANGDGTFSESTTTTSDDNGNYYNARIRTDSSTCPPVTIIMPFRVQNHRRWHRRNRILQHRRT